MKATLKRGLQRLGLHGYTRRSLPTGVDWLHDIHRSGLVPSNPVCIDVGANIGQTVRELLAAWPQASIHAFEPFAAPFEKLRALCAQHPGAVAVQLALGAHATTMHVAPHAQSVLSSLHAPADESGAVPQPIRVEKLDSYCEERGIERVDVLKTDTEGYDLAVLSGAAARLAAHQISFVHVEVTFDRHNTRNTAFAPVQALLDAHDYRFLGLYETYPLHHFPEPNVFCNALFVSRRRWAAGSGRRA